MSIKQYAMEVQKKRINGPFEKVLYIAPYPNQLLKTPGSAGGKFTILIGILSFLMIPVIAIIGQMENTIRVEPEWLKPIADFILQTVFRVAQQLEIVQIAAVMILVLCCMFLFMSTIFLANILNAYSVLRAWKSTCVTAQGQVLDSEIQKRLVVTKTRGADDLPSTRTRTRWEYRVKVAFEYRNNTYQATPSVVNRIRPGSLGQDFKTLEQCEKALRDLGSSVALEINPQNPLDCELKGQVESMARMVWGSLKYYPIFAGAILGFGWLFIFIAENGQ
ncbi:MAG: hypothetical protein PVJ68_17150 [Candidatus Thiodiazotropha sp.]|jgi:hypothetical protein